MLVFLSLNIVNSLKLKVFLKIPSPKTVHNSEQILSDQISMPIEAKMKDVVCT